jgi:hypothetical protein
MRTRFTAILAAATLAGLLTGCTGADDTVKPAPARTTPAAVPAGPAVTTFNDGVLVALVEPGDVQNLTGDVEGVGQERAARAYSWAVAFQALGMTNPDTISPQDLLTAEDFSAYNALFDETGAARIRPLIANAIAEQVGDNPVGMTELWNQSPLQPLAQTSAVDVRTDMIKVTGWQGGDVRLAGQFNGLDLIEVTVEVTAEIPYLDKIDNFWRLAVMTRGVKLTLLDTGDGRFLIHGWDDVELSWAKPEMHPTLNG